MFAKSSALLVMLVLAGGSLLAQEYNGDIAVKVNQVRDNLYLLNCSNGRRWVNVTMLTGPDGILLVDAGHSETATALLDSIRNISSADIKYLINTHIHRDHTGGDSLLGCDATVMAHANTIARLERSYQEKNLPLPPGYPTMIVNDSVRFTFNGDTIRVIHLPNGHTDGDLIVHFVQAGVVCMGDQLFTDALPFIFPSQGGGVDAYIANIGRVCDMFSDSITIIPGHGRLYTRAELKKYQQMLAGVTGRIRDEMKAGKSTEEIFASDVLAPWKDWVSQEYVCDSAFVLVVRAGTQ